MIDKARGRVMNYAVREESNAKKMPAPPHYEA